MPDTPTDLEITYRRCFGTKEGIDVLEDLMERGGILAVEPTLEPTKMAFMAGQRNIVLWILGMSGRTKIQDLEVLCRKNMIGS